MGTWRKAPGFDISFELLGSIRNINAHFPGIQAIDQSVQCELVFVCVGVCLAL